MRDREKQIATRGLPSQYRNNGVQEYLVWLAGDQEFRWSVSQEGRYQQQRDESGILKSPFFPGLPTHAASASQIQDEISRLGFEKRPFSLAVKTPDLVN